ncbi:hypothetical protein HGP14_23755 [Rhizobium sp. P32RR-XVIII]|nr:hypothetical protein [Rhizobium sp. P32RR-XVIII]
MGDCQRVFDQLTKEIILAAVEAGWRENEASIALADAADGYVMYVAAAPRVRQAANGNLARKR